MEKLIIDVSEHQGYIDWDAVKPKIDGVIIRCGYGDDDADQDDKRWKYNVAQCEKLGIPYGVYLYSYANTDAHAKSEAAHALRLLKGHKPQYPVYIDLEEGSYGGYAVRCADIFCKAIKEAGYIPGVYTFESFYNSFMDGYDKYTLWIAKYGVNDGKPHSKPNISKPYDAWQFSSMYYMRGYSDRLDVSYFYKDFSGSSTPTPVPEPTPTVTIDRGKLAAAIHKDMVDDDSNGYSWEPRWGEDGKGVKTITAYGMKVSYDRGSYDCASSVVTAWKAALKGTKYEHALDGATWTGNIAQVFVDSGLFVKKPISFIASPGDLYLRHDSDGDGHVAMCQTQEPDVMSEFSINEHSGVYGGQVGDQTGREAAVNPFRDEFYWVIHYNGKADSEVTPTPEPTPAPTPQPTPSYKKGKYKVLVNNLNVRAKASTASQSVAKYQKGQTLIADKVVTKNGYVWASYIGRSSGKRRYVAIAKADDSKKYMKHV